MVGRNILMYFPWSRPDEEGATFGNLNNRFGAFFEYGVPPNEVLATQIVEFHHHGDLGVPNVFGGRLLICDATIWTSTNGGLGSLRQVKASIKASASTRLLAVLGCYAERVIPGRGLDQGCAFGPTPFNMRL